MHPPSLDIVLPCYNPQEEWTQTVVNSFSKICNTLNGTLINLIIIDDGSTIAINKDLNFLKERIPQLRIESYAVNRGKGYAVRKGVALSEADIVIYTDIDFPYKEEGVVSIYRRLAAGECDIAMGTRDGDYYQMVPAFRKLISKLLKRIIRLALNTPTADTQAGLKGFNTKGKEIFLQTGIDRYLFDLEFIVIASRRNQRICCVPVSLKQSIIFSKMNPVVLWRELFNLFKILIMRHSN